MINGIKGFFQIDEYYTIKYRPLSTFTDNLFVVSRIVVTVLSTPEIQIDNH